MYQRSCVGVTNTLLDVCQMKCTQDSASCKGSTLSSGTNYTYSASLCGLIHLNFISLKPDKYLVFLSAMEYKCSFFFNYIQNYEDFRFIGNMELYLLPWCSYLFFLFFFKIKLRYSLFCAHKK